jgi:hypothetical protein
MGRTEETNSLAEEFEVFQKRKILGLGRWRASLNRAEATKNFSKFF